MVLKFTLGGIKLIESHFRLNLDFNKGWDKPVEMPYTINLSYKKKSRQVEVTVSINSDDKNKPFIFNVSIMGIFNFQKIPLKKADLEKIVDINCASIIFPYIRETISDLTRRSGIPPFNMPPVNFVTLHEKRIKDLQRVKRTKKEKVKQI